MDEQTNQSFVDAVWARSQTKYATTPETFDEAFACYVGKSIDFDPSTVMTCTSVVEYTPRSPARKVRVWNRHTVAVLCANGTVVCNNVQTTELATLNLAGAIDIATYGVWLAVLTPGRVLLYTATGLDETMSAFAVDDKSKRVQVLATEGRCRVYTTGGRSVWAYSADGVLERFRTVPGTIMGLTTTVHGLAFEVYASRKLAMYEVDDALATRKTTPIEQAPHDACHAGVFTILVTSNVLHIITDAGDMCCGIPDIVSAWLDVDTGLLVYGTKNYVGYQLL